MKLFKNIISLALAALMVCSVVVATGVFSAVSVSAIAGAGIKQTSFRSYGADISFWNVSSGSTNNYSLVDFAKMKADGCEYVILRIGYEARATRENTIDSAFIEYYKRGRAAGMPMGVYFYQLCDTYEEAVEDANWVIKIIEENDMYFEYPIYYDVEEPEYGDKPINLQGQAMENLCLGWCETLEKAGYFPGIYGGGWSVIDKLSDNFRAKYDTWYAAYPNAQNPHLTTDKSNYCGMWQYASSGYNYDGVPANASLDVNVCYKDYPAIMRQYGYNNCVGDGNITYGKTYAAAGIYSDESGTQPYPDTNGTELTDGRNPAADGAFDDASFVGFNVQTEPYVQNGYASVTVDLGGYYKVDAFNAKVATKFHAHAGIFAPKEVSYYVSYDKVNWYEAGKATPADSETNSVADAKFTTTEDTYARYIQYRIVGNSNWIMVSEVEAFGNAVTSVPQYPVPQPPVVEPPVVEPEPSDEPSEPSDEPSDPVEPPVSEPSDPVEPPVSEPDEPSDPDVPVDPPVDPEIPDVPDVKKGDINENGVIDSMDYVYLRRAYFGTYKLRDEAVGDINGNGVIGSMDYVYLRRAYFGTYEIS